MHKRARLADGFHRPSDDDNSSSGCSSAGPGALRNMMPSPISPPNGRSLSGSLYGRPSPTEEQQLPMNRMLSSSRYLPYTIRPLVVRAKRKLQNDSNVHVTSTAQRIINALDHISTPVVNSAKVPYEPLLSSRPVFTPIRRDTQGPPIMKSPLVPTPHGKIMYNPTMHIPRMVDFGTNTDMTMSTFNTELIQEDAGSNLKGYGGGKIKSVSSRMHAAPLKTSYSTSVPAPVLHENIARQPSVVSKYKFCSSWSTRDLSSVCQKKAEVRDTLSKIPLVTSTQSVGSLDSVKSNAVAKQPDGAQTALKPLSALVSNAHKTWECPACMVPNKSEAGECVCCATKNPAAPTVKNWDCPTCMVPNKGDAAVCVCCGEKNPTAVQVVLKNWDCPTCMVSNKPDAATCVCCTEKNPNKSVSAAVSTPATKASSFQFGFGSSTPNPPTTSSTPNMSQHSALFTFGAPKDSSTPKSTFTFGVKSDTQSGSSNTGAGSTSAAPASGGSFKFGVPKVAESPKSIKVAEATVSSTAESPGKQFTFGSVNKSPTKPPISPITFGLPAEPSAATAIKSPSFSLPVKAPEAAVSPKAVVPQKAADKLPTLGQSNNVFSSFTFGAPKPSTQINSISSVKEESELWQCKQCPARNRSVVTSCVGCSGRKPSAEPPQQTGKRFHFEPFFGGKNDDRVDSYSTPEPELKRKVPGGGFNSSGSSSTGFMYTPPTETTLKLKPTVEAAPATQSTEIKTGSFLDALKTGSQFTFAAPAPGTSLIPTGPSGVGTTSGTVSAATSSSVPATISSTVSSTSSTHGTGPPPGLFQFGAASSMSNASASTNLSLPGSTNNNALNQSTFTFGGMKNGPLSSSTSTAPSVFGSPLSTAGTASSSVFGTPVGNSTMTSPALSSTGAGNTAHPPPSYNLTPSFNFGGAPTNQGSGSFVFTAQPSPSPGPPGDGGMAGRKIRTARRRMQR